MATATRDAPVSLRSVRRLDSILLDSKDATYFTSEGYLVDHPILTSIGIFEYHNDDGSLRRELRLPEHVFNENSLKTYKGKPIIITHDAGEVNKDNVGDETIGTILSTGYQDGDNVRAEIIIHDTNSMKESGLKELSLGYSLDLIEEPGTWKGEHYDAIQTNIVINHLALVSAARAGDKARLNIDSKNAKTLKGGKAMKMKHRDGASDLSPEELEKAIALYKATQPLFGGTVQSTEKTDEEEEEEVPTEVVEQPVEVEKEKEEVVDAEEEEPKVAPKAPVAPPTPAPKAAPTPAPAPEKAEPTGGVDTALNAKVIEVLKKTIADLEAQMGGSEKTDEEDEISFAEDGEEEPQEVEETEETEEEPDLTFDNDDLSKSKAKAFCADSADVVREKVNVCRMGDRLNLDGLEDLSVIDAKKAIIEKVLPGMRLDGKSKGYINAAYDFACSEIDKDKDVDYQRRQMFNGRTDSMDNCTMAESARQRMINRERGNE